MPLPVSNNQSASSGPACSAASALADARARAHRRPHRHAARLWFRRHGGCARLPLAAAAGGRRRVDGARLVSLAQDAGDGRRRPGAFGRLRFWRTSMRDAAPQAATGRTSSGFTMPSFGGGHAPAAQTRDIELGQADLDTFEKRLAEVQAAFAAEDHAALRRLTTPEMVSFFSEELADNAKRGVRNEVTDVHLVQADIAEAWSEGDEDFVTAAFRYESVDVMRDRQTGALAGGVEQPTETVELWTFVRSRGGEWKLSAIQEAADALV